MSLKTVKSKIKSIDKTRQVTKAMEAVSAIKMRKSQADALSSRPYALNALKILKEVSGSSLGKGHPLSEVRQGKKTLVILVTSDRGLAGSLNSAVLKAFEKFIKEHDLAKSDLKLIAVGRRGYEYASKRGYDVIEHAAGWGDFISFREIEPIIKKTQEIFLEASVDSAWIISTNFISTLRQEVHVRKLLPLSYEAIKETVRAIAPQTGKFSELNKEEKHSRIVEYIVEPDPETIAKELFEELLKIELYHTILEANASEHSARMIAMKNASDNAGDILKGLRLAYNKERQAGITKELSEIVGGVEALASN